MAGDVPKPINRGKVPAKPTLPTPPAAVAAIPVAQPAPVTLPKPVLPKPPQMKVPAAMRAPEPKAVPTAAALPGIVAPEPSAAIEPIVPEPVAAPAAAPSPEPTPSTSATAPEASPAAILHKEKTTMEATIQEATVKTQAYIGDANARAKAAMEKSAKMFEDMSAFGKGNIEAVVESSKIAAKGFETLGQEAADYTRKQFEGATAMMKSFASVKSPAELFKMQSDYIRQSFDSLVAESSKTTEAVLKLAGEVAQPLSNRVALAAEQAKIAA